MFKFRRSRRSMDPVADEHDDEPMRGTSYKGRPPGGGGRHAGSSYGGVRRKQPRPGHRHDGWSSSSQGDMSSSKPVAKNYAGNTRNKLNGARPSSGGARHHLSAVGASSKVSWISDTCSETDVTETWTTDMCSSDQGSEESEGSSASAKLSAGGSSQASESIEGAESVDDYSRGEGSSAGVSYDEHGECYGSVVSGETHSSGGGGESQYSVEMESGILFSSAEGKTAEAQSTAGRLSSSSRRRDDASGSMSYPEGEDASYTSVGDNAGKTYKRANNTLPTPKCKTELSGNSHHSSASVGDGIVRNVEGVGHTRSNGQGNRREGGSNRSRRNWTCNQGKEECANSRSRSGGSNGCRKGIQDLEEVPRSNRSMGGSSAAPSTMGANVSQNKGHHAFSLSSHQHEEKSMKLKPPSMKGMMPNSASKIMKRTRRLSSVSAGDDQSCSSTPQAGPSGATVAAMSVSDCRSVASEGAHSARSAKSEASTTEVAAMQQLAYLVVSLRSDLREANLARDDLESKVENLEKQQQQGPMAMSSSKPYSDDSRVRHLEKENAHLQADVDAFIAEQDDLKKEIKQLSEDKNTLNDMISRLKREASAERSKAFSAARDVGYGSKSDLEEVKARVQDLTEENHKLEKEIQLLVGEKSQLVSSSESRVREIEQLQKSLNENVSMLEKKERAAQDMQEKIDSLTSSLEGAEKEMKESNLSVMVLEDELEKKEGEIDGVRADLLSEKNKMTLLRQRLSQVEKQKGELLERNSALDGVMLGLKKKMEELLKERNATRPEMEGLRRENESLAAELENLKMMSFRAVAKEAHESDTLLNLQKMIVSLEESKKRLEEELDHRNDQAKVDRAKIGQLEERICTQQEMESEGATRINQLKSEITELQDLKMELEGKLEAQGALEDELDDKEARISQLESRLRAQQELSRAGNEEESGDEEGSGDEEESGVEEELECLKEHISDLNVENDELQAKVENLTTRNENMQSKLDDFITENKDIQSKLEVLSEENEEMHSKMDGLQSKLCEMELEKSCAEDDHEDFKLGTAKTIKDLEGQVEELQAQQGGLNSLAKTRRDLEEKNRVSLDTISDLQKMISQLEESKIMLEEEMHEATDAIAMLEDELDHKDAQVKELLMKLTMLQQQFSQADKCKTALAERNAKLSSDNDDLNTQIKVLIIEKKVIGEEVETLKAMKTIADEDQEETLLKKEEQKQEIDKLMDKLEQQRDKSQEKLLALEQEIYGLEQSKNKLEEDLEESNDAIAMLREALTGLEAEKTKCQKQIGELKTLLEEKEISLKTTEATHIKFQADHQVSVDTIAALQKMISTLEASKEDLEEELNASSSALIDLKEQLKKANSLEEIMELENQLKKAEEKNGKLTSRIADMSELEDKLSQAEAKNLRLADKVTELSEVNEKMKDQVKDLGKSLAKVSAKKSHALSASSTSLMLPSDPVASCDALISELKNQIKEIVSTRNAALEEIEFLKNDGVSIGSHATMPPTHQSGAEQKPVSSETKKKPSLTLDDSVKSEPSEESPSTKTIEKSAGSSAHSHAGSRGSSLLEAAKKLCDQLDEKRSKESELEKVIATEKISSRENTSKREESKPPSDFKIVSAVGEEPVKNIIDQDIDDNVSAKEVKEDLPAQEMEMKDPNTNTLEKPQSHEEDKKDLNRASSRSRGRFDIDQLTSIYFEKCGMSVSKFSDLSSDSSSFRRRAKAPSDTVTKKVKICRNGVFMGTYEGDLNPDGQRHGFGVLLCDNGNSYEGEWKKDKRDGLGIARYSSGDVYDGQWQRGKRQGHGVMYIEAGDTYIGSWNNGLKHGAGTYHWADGEVDVSWYQNDRRVGEGVRWNASRSKAYRLQRGTKKEELSLDEAYMTAEKLGLNLEKFDSGVP